MGTVLQQNLAKEIVKNTKRKKPLNKGQLLEAAGYDTTTAKATPERTIQQIGVREELKVMGFDPLTAARVTSELMSSKKVPPRDRLRAVDITFKVHGTYAPEKKLVGISDLRQMSDDELNERIASLEAGEV